MFTLQSDTGSATLDKIIFLFQNLFYSVICEGALLPHSAQNECRLRVFWIIGSFLEFCYVVFNSHVLNVTLVQLCKWCFHKKFLFFMRPIHMWRSRTPVGVRCAHFPGVITTIMDQKVQLLKPQHWTDEFALSNFGKIFFFTLQR
jgi:hypothetical protein